MKIYFAGSIRGGREKIEDYKKIIQMLSGYGEVLTEFVADESLLEKEKGVVTDVEICTNNISLLHDADVMIAEVTLPSLGVGYEVGFAVAHNKKVICLYQEGVNLSAMVSGNANITHIEYSQVSELSEKLSALLQ